MLEVDAWLDSVDEGTTCAQAESAKREAIAINKRENGFLMFKLPASKGQILL